MADDSGRSPVVYVALGLFAGVVISAGAGYFAWQVLKPAPPPTTMAAAPPTTQAPAPPLPTPAPEASPAAATDAAAAPAPAAIAPGAGAEASPRRPKPASPKPVVAGPGPPPAVATLLTQAETAVSEKKYADATSIFDEILKQDPNNAAARAGRNATLALGRSFVFALPSAESLKGNPGKLQGFDPTGIEVKKAPDVPGRIDFEVTPPHVKPGDNYNVKVYLINTGKKTIKVKDVAVTRTVNGSPSTETLLSRAKEVEPMQRVLVQTIPGVWAGDTSSWALGILVKSSKGDSYQNEVVWK